MSKEGLLILNEFKPDGIHGPQTRPVTRRELFQVGATAGVGILAVGLGIRHVFRAPEVSEEATEVSGGSDVILVDFTAPQAVSGEADDKKSIVFSSQVERFAAGYSQSDRETLDKMIDDQSEYFRMIRFGKNKQALELARQRVNDYVPMIETIANEEGIADNSFIRDILPGIILTESDGQSMIKGGLTQITPIVLDQLALPRNTQLEKPDTNLRVAMQYLHYLQTKTYDPRWAIWGFHVGWGRLSNAVRIVSQLVDEPTIPQLVHHPKMADELLFGNNEQDAQGVLQYVPRVLAATDLVNGVR